MIGSSKNNRENYPRKCFWTQEKETQVKFNPGLSANRPSNNWAQGFFLLFKRIFLDNFLQFFVEHPMNKLEIKIIKLNLL